ncbi:hypothetical protein EDD15DRAFT_2371785 [Pisolithus albus]|nr:hypothetical protein EDD15DRAFT_2371785 [Pisolithus albus]
MSQCLKAELKIWADALKAYDDQEPLKSIELFSQIAKSGKILTNMGLIYATMGNHEMAIEQFDAATNLDNFLAVAYIPVSYIHLFVILTIISSTGIFRYIFTSPRKPIHASLLFCRYSAESYVLVAFSSRNYEQLGLKFKLFSAEVLFNRGLSQLHLGYSRRGLNDLEQAGKEKVTTEHDVIDHAIRDGGERYTVFSVPAGVLYRPPEQKLRNLKSKEYLGKVKLVVGNDVDSIYTELLDATNRFRNSYPGKVSLPLESTLNAVPIADIPSTLKRRFTAPTLRIRSIGPSPIPEPEHSEFPDDVSETKTGNFNKMRDDETSLSSLSKYASSREDP